MHNQTWNMILIAWADTVMSSADASEGSRQGTKTRPCNEKFVEMTPRDQVPFEFRSLDAEQAGELLGYSARYVREDLACRHDFPKRVDGDGHPRWIAGELLAWREAIRTGRQARRRRGRSADRHGNNRGTA